MESKNITPENQYSSEQEIISLYYHTGLSPFEIACKYQYSKKFVAKVLSQATIDISAGSFIIESSINYINQF